MASGLCPAGNEDKDGKGREKGRSAGWDQVLNPGVWPAICTRPEGRASKEEVEEETKEEEEEEEEETTKEEEEEE